MASSQEKGIIAAARRATFQFLCRIELGDAHSDDVLHSAAMAELEPRDRNLVTEICHGTLRWRAWLDYILEHAVARPWDQVDTKAQILLRFSLYQMSRMDRMPDHAVIHDAVEIAKQNLRSGTGGFINGVLRNLGRRRPWKAPDFHRDCPIWVRASLPRWLWERWERTFGIERAFEYAVSLNQPAQTAFRFLGGTPAGETSSARASDLVSGCYLGEQGSPRRDSHEIHFQDEASQLIPALFGPIDGDLVLDACAAPGGKASIMIDRCGTNGKVISTDLSEPRAQAMARFLRLRTENRSEIVIADAQASLPFRIGFDAVLADVPCSGLGTLRRNPEIKWRIQQDRLKELSQRQAEILERASEVVRHGGKLLYSTCSTEPEENEQVVRGFLESHAPFRLMRPQSPPGIESWLDEDGFFRSFPGPRLWDGFFAALMMRME
jgi:16S rRNA (cytosine967-C5)-methyltransferase